MKLPVAKNDQSAIPFKFIQNPFRINDLDQLYDILYEHSDSNMKYFLIYNPLPKNPKNMSI